MEPLTNYEKSLIKAYKEAIKSVNIHTPEWERLKDSGLADSAFCLGFSEGFKAATDHQKAENKRLQAENDAYDKYIKGYLSLGQLEEALKEAMGMETGVGRECKSTNV